MNKIIGSIASGIAEPLTYIYVPLRDISENTPSSKGNGLVRSNQREEKEEERNFPIGRSKRRCRARSRGVFSAPYVSPLDGEAS